MRIRCRSFRSGTFPGMAGAWPWLLGAALSFGCGRTARNQAELPAEHAPSAPAAGGAAAHSDADEAGESADGGAASSPVVRECGPLIDDMEDGTGRICAGAGRVGAWYAFNDQKSESTQWPAPKPPGTPIETSPIPGGRAGSRRAMHTYGKGNGWGAGIGVDLSFDGKTYGVYDARQYQGVHFWARGSVSRDLTFRISTASTTATEFGGNCEANSRIIGCYAGPVGVAVPLTSEWQEYSVSFAKLNDINERDRLTNIQFLARGDFDFWIDDVSFIEGQLSCCPTLPACEGGVHLADATARRELLNVDDPAAVMDCGDVCGLNTIVLADPALQSLEGFQCFSQLEQLSIAASSIEDLGPLAGLTGLNRLHVEHSQVRSTRPLSALTNLRTVGLSHNSLTEVEGLRGLTQLEELDLSDNALTDVAPLEDLTVLQRLLLGKNQIRDASPVSNLPALSTLELQDNLIDYLGQNVRLPVLFKLDLSNNQLTDINALAALSSAAQLYLAGNRISDASPLARLTQLTELDLSKNSIATLNGEFAFRGLEILDVSSNGLNLIPASALSGSVLSHVSLAHNALVDLSALEPVVFKPSVSGGGRNYGGTVSGASLDVSDNQVQDLAPLARSTWQNVAITAAHNPIDCAQQASAVESLRARTDSIDICP